MPEKSGARPNPATGPANLLAALLLALVGAGALTVAYFVEDLVQHVRLDVPYYRSPSFFPFAALLVVGLGSLMMAVRTARHGPEPSDEALPRTRKRPLLVASVAVLFALYIAGVPLLGYLLATTLFGATALALSGKKLLHAGLSAAIAGALLWLIFVQVLGVWFPDARLIGMFAGR